MEPIAVEEEMEADRDWEVAGDVREGCLQEAREVIAGAHSVGIPNRTNEAFPARRFSVRSARRR
jgi:hypothetical protein